MKKSKNQLEKPIGSQLLNELEQKQSNNMMIVDISEDEKDRIRAEKFTARLF